MAGRFVWVPVVVDKAVVMDDVCVWLETVIVDLVWMLTDVVVSSESICDGYGFTSRISRAWPPRPGQPE